MATDVSAYFFERKLQENAFGLTYQVAVAVESFVPALSQSSKILLVPSMGGDGQSDDDLQSFVTAFLGTTVVTSNDLNRVLVPYGTTPAMTRLLVSNHQRAFAAHMLRVSNNLKYGRKWPRQAIGVDPLHAPISDLELLGSVNQLKADPTGAEVVLASMRSSAPERFWEEARGFPQVLARCGPLASYACQKLGVRYMVLTYIRHPHHQSNFGGVGRYPEKVQMAAGVIDLRDGTFVLYAESETKAATAHAPPGLLLATMLRQVLLKQEQKRKVH